MNRVVNYMKRNLVLISGDRTVKEAVYLMRENNIGAVLIADSDNEPMGIFTERDLIKIADFDHAAVFGARKISEVMTKNLVTVDEEKSYIEVIKLMRQHNIRHMPVSREGKIVGMVSLRDLLMIYEEQLEGLLKQREEQVLGQVERLRESDQRMRTIFNNSAVGIVFLDKQECLVEWNVVAEKISGMSGEELRDKSVKEFFPVSEWKKIRFERIRHMGGDHHIETKFMNKDGHLIDISLSVSVIKDTQDKISGLIGVFQDISKRKRAEEQLAMSLEDLETANRDLQENAKLFHSLAQDREKALKDLQGYQQQIIQMEKMATLGTLAAGFAHAIKNPLGIIIQGLERIEKVFGQEGGMDHMKYVLSVRNAAMRANNVVTSLLQFSRSSRLDLEPLNIFDIIDHAIEFLKSNRETTNVQIQKEFKAADGSMMGDKVMLQQVFVDLFVNAVDAMPQGGRIAVSVDFEQEISGGSKGYFVIKVRDTGTGIPEEILPRVFDPFVTTKDEGKGVGLGLSTAFLIVERHKGTIQASNEDGESPGAVFTIRLPLEGAQEIKRRFEHV